MALYINKVFNVSGAWEHLQEASALELSEIQVALSQLDKVQSPKLMRDEMLLHLNLMGWKCRNYLGGGKFNFKEFKPSSSKPSRIQMAGAKGNIALDLNMSMPTNLDSWVTFRAKSASALGIIPVLLMPIDYSEDSSFKMSFDYVIQRIRYLDIVEGNKFLVLGFSSEYFEIEIFDADSVIRRTITFEPHQVQAGVSLLSYFSEVLKQKCLESHSKVSIEQDGDTVRLMIKSEAGLEHKVEALLNDYGGVLNGTLAPDKFMTDQVQLLSLRSKLDMAAMEVKHQQDILALTRVNYDQRIVSLEQQVTELKEILSNSIIYHRIAQEHVSKLIDNYGKDSEIELQLLNFAKKLDERSGDVGKKELEQILRALNTQNPKLATEFLGLLKGPLEGVVGSIIYSWLPQLSGIIGIVIR